MKKMNRMSRKHLFLTTMIARRGRMFKEGESHSGGGDNGGQGGGESQGDSGAQGQQQNNTGETFDGSSFWNSPASQPNGAPNGESAPNGNGESGAQGSANLGQQLTTQLASMKFGDPIFTPEIAEQINNGDFNGVQQRFDAMMQNGVKQALGMMIQVMRPFGEQLQAQMRSEFGETLNGRDNNDALIKDFPSAKDPRLAPTIRQVFDQALKNTGGKRDLAVKQTKDMLALMSSAMSGDLGLNLVPQGSDPSASQPSVNWLDELTIR